MHPLRARNVHTARRAIIVLSLFWLSSFVLLLPQLFIQRLEPLLLLQPDVPEQQIRLATVCVEYFSHPAYNYAYTFFFYFVLYLCPVAIISATYGVIARKLWTRRRIGETPDDERRLLEKKRIVRMLVVIVVLFAVSWFPFFTCQLYLLFTTASSPPRILLAVLQLVGYSNCCINPFIYCFMNEKFQKNAVSTVCCCCASRHLLQRKRRSGSCHTYMGEPTKPLPTSQSLLTDKTAIESPFIQKPRQTANQSTPMLDYAIHQKKTKSQYSSNTTTAV